MNITDSALIKLSEIYANNNRLTRLSVMGGGCSGFSYKFELGDQNDDDILICDQLLVDPVSLSILENATIDYVSDLTGSYFSVKIPEANSYCGCGTSFSL